MILLFSQINRTVPYVTNLYYVFFTGIWTPPPQRVGYAARFRFHSESRLISKILKSSILVRKNPDFDADFKKVA